MADEPANKEESTSQAAGHDGSRGEGRASIATPSSLTCGEGAEVDEGRAACEPTMIYRARPIAEGGASVQMLRCRERTAANGAGDACELNEAYGDAAFVEGLRRSCALLAATVRQPT